MPLTITRIPERYQRGLATINALPAETVAAIAAALGKASVSSRKELIAAVEQASRVSNEDAEAIITTLRSLYIFKTDTESSISEFIPVLITAMQGSSNQGLAVSNEHKAVVITKLTSLLSLSTLERDSKIEQLKADHQIIFSDAKILTDLRPVFDEPKEPPIGAILTHALKIIYHESGEHKELYFALDAEGVRTLQKIAERAADKMCSLQALLKSANIPDLS